MKFVVLAVVSFFAPLFASAHVSYVIAHDEILTHRGSDALYLLDAFANPHNMRLMLTASAIVIILYWAAHHNYFMKEYLAEIRTRLTSYYEFIPWILRLSLGIALIGSGAHGALISPVLSGYAIFGFLQLIVGFLLLAGFLLIPAALVALGLFIFAFTRDVTLFGNLEFAGAALAMIILENPRPGIDDILLFPRLALTEFTRYIPFILRLGLGGSMLFLAFYEKICNPHVAELVVNQFHLTNFIHVSPAMWVLSTGLIEAILGIFIIIGFRTRLTSAIAFVVISFTFFVFKEDVYSHITLFGVLSVLFITGGGALSIDKLIAKSLKKMTPHSARPILAKVKPKRKRASAKKKSSPSTV